MKHFVLPTYGPLEKKNHFYDKDLIKQDVESVSCCIFYTSDELDYRTLCIWAEYQTRVNIMYRLIQGNEVKNYSSVLTVYTFTH